jgi:type I restriction-modification system DNA methylase subunit
MANNDFEKRLWEAADQLRANSKLKASEYSMPVLGLIFLRYADSRFTKMQQVLQAQRAQAAGVEPESLPAIAPDDSGTTPRAAQGHLSLDKLALVDARSTHF